MPVLVLVPVFEIVTETVREVRSKYIAITMKFHHEMRENAKILILINFYNFKHVISMHTWA